MARKMASRKQDWDLAARLVANFPQRQLTVGEAQYWIDHPQHLGGTILRALTSPASIFNAMLEDCRQDSVDPNITVEHFPLVDDGTTGEVEEFFTDDKEIFGFEVDQKLRELGFMLVGMRRAMKYIAVHPDNQLVHPIVVIGAKWYHSKEEGSVPCFCNNEVMGRVLRLYPFNRTGNSYTNRCRFLVCREPAAK